MAAGRRGGARRPTGPAVGSIVTGMVVGQAKRGVLVELGPIELLLPRSRYGAGADRIEEAGYGVALTVEVIADPEQAGGTGLSRVGIERSLRQPRPIEGEIGRAGSGTTLIPAGGSPPFAVVLLDRVDVDLLVGTTARWLVGAPHRGVRFVLVGEV